MAIQTKPTSKSAIWGCTSQDGDTYASAKIVSMSVDLEGQEEPLLDSNGETVGLCLFDDKQPIQVDVIAEASITAPLRGATIIVDGVSGTVLKVSKKWEQKGWKKLSIQATFYPNLEEDSSVAQVLPGAKNPTGANSAPAKAPPAAKDK